MGWPDNYRGNPYPRPATHALTSPLLDLIDPHYSHPLPVPAQEGVILLLPVSTYVSWCPQSRLWNPAVLTASLGDLIWKSDPAYPDFSSSNP